MIRSLFIRKFLWFYQHLSILRQKKYGGEGASEGASFFHASTLLVRNSCSITVGTSQGTRDLDGGCFIWQSTQEDAWQLSVVWRRMLTILCAFSSLAHRGALVWAASWPPEAVRASVFSASPWDCPLMQTVWDNFSHDALKNLWLLYHVKNHSKKERLKIKIITLHLLWKV